MTQNLPIELWQNIWLFLDIQERVKIQRVCKTWHDCSIASKNLWKGTLYLRDDQEINADTKLDYSILSQIKSWKDDVRFDQLSITLRCDTTEQFKASVNFLEMLPFTNVRDLVLGSGDGSRSDDWSTLYVTRIRKVQICMNLRALIMNSPRGSMPPLARKGNATPTQLEILSISMNKENYHGQFQEEKQNIRMASSFQEGDPIRHIVKKARVIDLLDTKEQICDCLTISFLEIAANTLEYLTINIVSAAVFSPSCLPAETKIIHFSNLRFFALEADDLRQDAVRFNCPNLQSLQVSHVPNLEIFKPCPPLQSLYINGNFDDKSKYWHFLELIPNKNLQKLFVKTSPQLFRIIIHQLHNNFALPKLQKLVVIKPIPSLTEQCLLDLYGPPSSINRKLHTLIWQYVNLPKQNESKEKNGLEFILKHVADNFTRYDTNPEFPNLTTYRFSPTILDEFAECRNVMEKRKLFFDGDVIRKNFLFNRSNAGTRC